MHIFDIMGPVMVGPSSSHTAGAVRMGRLTRRLLASPPVYARISLHGSFAATGTGHGTDRALVAGLLGMTPDDGDIPKSIMLAGERGLALEFDTVRLPEAHPNTAVLRVTDAAGRALEVRAASLGGGRIQVTGLDGTAVSFGGEGPTLIIYHEDKPGAVYEVTAVLYKEQVNISAIQLRRDSRGGGAVMVVESDEAIDAAVIDYLKKIPGFHRVVYLGADEAPGAV